MKAYRRSLYLLTLIVFFTCGSEENKKIVPSDEVLEFTIDGVLYQADVMDHLTSISSVNSFGFTGMNASGLFISGTSNYAFRLGFDGETPGTYQLSGRSVGTDNGLDIKIRNGLSNTMVYEAASVTLEVKRYQIEDTGVSWEASLSGTLINTDTQETVGLSDGRIVILP